MRGIIYLFDELLRQELLTFELAINKMEDLKILNSRLPKTEVDKRIVYWKNKKHVG